MRWLFHVTHIGAIALTIAMTATAAVALPWPSDVPVQGPADAPVTILVASEFQCPFCARIGPTLRELVRRHPGQIRLAFGHFPLAFHANAVPAALAAHHLRTSSTSVLAVPISGPPWRRGRCQPFAAAARACILFPMWMAPISPTH